MPRVWNKNTEKPPKDAVFVGRPSKWGNPFLLAGEHTRDLVCDNYETYLYRDRPDLVDDAKEELDGKDLVCYCAPKRCHADTLLEIANSARWCDVCALHYDREDYPFGCPQH